MKIITLILSGAAIFICIAIGGCGDTKELRDIRQIEPTERLTFESMCMYIIDSAEGEYTLQPGDTMCINCPIDTLYKCYPLKYVSPVNGVVYKIREISQCQSCKLAVGYYMRRFKVKGVL